MTPGEQIGGTVLLALYLLVLPAVRDPLFDLAERLTGASLSPSLRSAVYYYALFAAVVVIFRRFLCRTSRNFTDNLGVACEAALTGLVALYGLNELVFRLGRVLVGGLTNLNDSLIAAPVPDAPRTTFLIAVVIFPIVEETLFRGLVFGGLKGKSRWIAYAASCCLPSRVARATKLPMAQWCRKLTMALSPPPKFRQSFQSARKPLQMPLMPTSRAEKSRIFFICS